MNLALASLNQLLLAVTEPAHGAEGGGGNILTSFGVSWGKFLAQVILFIIVYLVLKKFAFGPILEVLDERKRRIAAGEANLDKIRRDLAAAEERKAEIVGAANTQADRMIAEARESAEVVGERKRQDAVTEAGQIIAKAREATHLEREQLLAELKRDFGRLVIDTTSKVTGKVLTPDDQDKINRETAAQVAL